MATDRKKQIRFWRRRNRKILKRRRKLAERRGNRGIKLARAFARAPLAEHPKYPRRVHTLACPPQLNLGEDYKSTIQFLTDVRDVAMTFGGKFHVDLRPLKKVTAAAALMLVAEFDRWKELTLHHRLRAVDPEDWEPSVRKQLGEMGFFDLLSADCDIDDRAIEIDERFLRFKSGRGSEGHQARELRLAIEALGPRLRDGNTLYDGLVEAMTNVRQHAYQEGTRIPRWWMSASVNVKSGRLVVTFLDHGLGIPKTLPRGDLWEDVRGWFTKAGATLTRIPFNDDAQLIQAAMSVERTRTDEEHRGHGLKRDIQGYIESHNAYGRLRIISGYGRYEYEKRPGLESSVSIKALPLDLQGTFIEWKIEDYSEDILHAQRN
jgi:hypothetical protein